MIIWINFWGTFFEHPQELHTYSINGYAQGTSYHITYYHDTPLVNPAEITQLLSKMDSSLSIYQSYSLINQFNQSEKGVPINQTFYDVVKRSLEISEDTGGLFDITVAPLVNTWGFGKQPTPQIPDSLTIANIKPCVGWHLLELDKSYILKKKKSCVQVDVNGIAQGYTVDCIAQLLLAKNIHHFIVELGGEIRIHGRKPNGELMRVGVEGPVQENATSAIRHIIGLEKGAITTSGTYRKTRKNRNKTISHLIDPRTGYPLNNTLVSVTLYAPDAITADGYDNAIIAMPVEEALKFVDLHPNMEAYLIYRNTKGQMVDTMTNGFRQLLLDSIQHH